MNMPEGKIDVDSPFAQEIGFISAGFEDWSYLWGFPKDKTIIISMIQSKIKGAFSTLCRCIESRGLTFQVPTPSDRMREIGKKHGWINRTVDDEIFGKVEILEKKGVRA